MKLDFRSLYMQHEGSLDRTTFWLAGIILACIYMIVKYITGMLVITLVSVASQPVAQYTAYVLNILVPLAFLYPAYCLLVKRGLDRGRPPLIVQALGAFVAIVFIVPKLIILFSTQEDAKNTLQSISGGFWVIYLLLAVAATFVLIDYGLRSGKSD